MQRVKDMLPSVCQPNETCLRLKWGLLQSLLDPSRRLPAELSRVVLRPTELEQGGFSYPSTLGFRLADTPEVLFNPMQLFPGAPVQWLQQNFNFSPAQLPSNLPAPLQSLLVSNRGPEEALGDWRRTFNGWLQAPLFARVPLLPAVPEPLVVFVQEVELAVAHQRVAAAELEAVPATATPCEFTAGFQVDQLDKLLAGPRERDVALVVQARVRGQCIGLANKLEAPGYCQHWLPVSFLVVIGNQSVDMATLQGQLPKLGQLLGYVAPPSSVVVKCY